MTTRRLATMLADRPTNRGQKPQFGVDGLQVAHLPKRSGSAGARKPTVLTGSGSGQITGLLNVSGASTVSAWRSGERRRVPARHGVAARVKGRAIS